VGADTIPNVEGNILVVGGTDTKIPPGSKSRACRHWGSPGTWEILSSPPRVTGLGSPESKPLAPGG
jgi:hypothetical protein